MKKTWVYGAATLVVLGALTTACGSKDEVIPSVATGTKDAGTTTTVQVKTETGTGTGAGTKASTTSAKPAIDASYKVDGKNVTITYQTSNFKLSEEDMNKANVLGEGHLHLYVDGKQKAMIGKTGPLTLTNLTTGAHEIKLELQQNDHKEINVEKILNIVVK
ncbi:hypothetical protein PAECIP111891_04255 [Paenibacillus allorhizoplanae]|uniref:Lipoprotein n=1 Tax=Paenibacillus allorhizoplanae TaxID=2905648 RepID=A0ABN8GTJ7_9BACL|nr:DUF6130 family protein [Paenibacillus allorhizoplanae]CAH1215561.1 hypothetical protein PAECIP111891_04255 [Paenibacillus allorhizoplanae]